MGTPRVAKSTLIGTTRPNSKKARKALALPQIESVLDILGKKIHERYKLLIVSKCSNDIKMWILQESKVIISS